MDPKDTTRVKQISPTPTITPKTLLTSSPRTMTIGNNGMTDRLASTGTWIFPNPARSLSLTLLPPKPNSGRARRDGHEEHRTGERRRRSPFCLPPSRLIWSILKSLSSRWSLAHLTTNAPGTETAGAGTRRGRPTGEGPGTPYPHPKGPTVLQSASQRAEGIASARTELKSPTTAAGGRGRATGWTLTNSTARGMAGRRPLTRGEEGRGHPKRWGPCAIFELRQGIPLIFKTELWNTKGPGRLSPPAHRVSLRGSRPPRKPPPITRHPKGGRVRGKVKDLEDQRKVTLWSWLGDLETSAWHCTGKTARYVIPVSVWVREYTATLKLHTNEPRMCC